MSKMGKISFYNECGFVIKCSAYYSIAGRKLNIIRTIGQDKNYVAYYEILPRPFIRTTKHTHRGWGRKPTSVSTIQK